MIKLRSFRSRSISSIWSLSILLESCYNGRRIQMTYLYIPYHYGKRKETQHHSTLGRNTTPFQGAEEIPKFHDSLKTVLDQPQNPLSYWWHHGYLVEDHHYETCRRGPSSEPREVFVIFKYGVTKVKSKYLDRCFLHSTSIEFEVQWRKMDWFFQWSCQKKDLSWRWGWRLFKFHGGRLTSYPTMTPKMLPQNITCLGEGFPFRLKLD